MHFFDRQFVMDRLRLKLRQSYRLIGASRLNQDDENFRQDTVAQTGTIEAAVLIMRPHIISNRVADGRRARVTRTFTVEIVTVNGELIMKSDKQLGFSRTRGVVGW